MTRQTNLPKSGFTRIIEKMKKTEHDEVTKSGFFKVFNKTVVREQLMAYSHFDLAFFSFNFDEVKVHGRCTVHTVSGEEVELIIDSLTPDTSGTYIIRNGISMPTVYMFAGNGLGSFKQEHWTGIMDLRGRYGCALVIRQHRLGDTQKILSFLSDSVKPHQKQEGTPCPGCNGHNELHGDQTICDACDASLLFVEDKAYKNHRRYSPNG